MNKQTNIKESTSNQQSLITSPSKDQNKSGSKLNNQQSIEGIGSHKIVETEGQKKKCKYEKLDCIDLIDSEMFSNDEFETSQPDLNLMLKENTSNIGKSKVSNKKEMQKLENSLNNIVNQSVDNSTIKEKKIKIKNRNKNKNKVLELSEDESNKNRQGFTFLPIESQYYKLCKDENASHIPNIQDFECLACFHIVNHPKVCAECEKLICQECLDTWWSEKSTKDKVCIHCKKTFFDLFMPRIVRNSLNSIMIKCPNKSQCKESFEYQSLHNHLENCKYTKREAVCDYCKNIFSTSNEKKEILQHIASCPLADIACKYCNKTFSRKKFEKHNTTCKKKYRECGDCGVSYEISELNNHKKSECITNIKKAYEHKIAALLNNKIEENRDTSVNFQKKSHDFQNLILKENKETSQLAPGKDNIIENYNSNEIDKVELENESKPDYEEYLYYKEQYQKLNKLKLFVPYFMRFVINHNKIEINKKLQQYEAAFKIIEEKFGINLENHDRLTSVELLYHIYENVKKLPKKVSKIITNKKNISTIYYENGYKYEGLTKNGTENGKGCLYKLNLMKNYEGDFKDGLYHGQGKYYWTDGACYTGGFENDKKHGKGVLIMPHGEKYEGDFFNQTITGNGTYFYKDGTRYVGQWIDGKKHGEGIEYFSEGDVHYKGSFLKDKRNGFGILYEKIPFRVYEGKFIEGKMDNKNVIIYMNPKFEEIKGNN